MHAKHNNCGRSAANIRLLPSNSFFRVRLLYLQLVAMVISTAAMYLLPLSLSSTFLISLYAAIVWIEYRHDVCSPISFTLLTMSIVLFFGHNFLERAGYEAYSPVILFGCLFLVGSTLLIIGRPATSFYGGKNSLRALHRKTSLLWDILYALAIIAGLATLRYPIWFWVIPGLMLAGALVTLRLQLFSMGSAWRRPGSFTLGSYRFDQIPKDRAHLLAFYKHWVLEVLPSIRAGVGPKKKSYDQFVDLKMAEDSGTWNRTTFFLAYHGDEVVGTICCVVDCSSMPLPVETGHSEPIDLQQVRGYGKVVEVSRFSISKDHRFGQDLIQGLLCCVVEFSFEMDAAFLIIQSHLSALPIYRKIGFHALSEKIVYQNAIGAAVQLLGFNLARRVICGDKTQIIGKLQGILTPYLCERYLKRQAFRSLFRKKQAWRLSDEELSTLTLHVTPQGRA